MLFRKVFLTYLFSLSKSLKSLLRKKGCNITVQTVSESFYNFKSYASTKRDTINTDC